MTLPEQAAPGPPSHPELEFDIDTMRRLVAIDPLLVYTVVRHTRESEEHWLRLVFALEVRSDPSLVAHYRRITPGVRSSAG